MWLHEKTAKMTKMCSPCETLVSWLPCSALDAVLADFTPDEPAIITTRLSAGADDISSNLSHHRLDTFHWRNYPDVNQVKDPFFPFLFKCPRVRPCECGCIHEDTLFPIPSGWIQLISGWMDVWPYFPGIKVG
ncbi:uncharacterized protein LOC124348518 [Daphnia pulicaria]|uniref:uncharacterized protein LOC124348518 n=1 Tax=Daphnia pulicaria TaxID=35523 RepID=UPI001EEAC466|nr:uncharacterized protein LOC124348518 [Daphnia pulicaria]